MQHLVAPSILSADFTNLEKEIKLLNKSEADWIHIDVMDGVFVPNITLGFPIIKQLKKHSKKPFDVHLMIVHPDKYLSEFKDAGADILTLHYEACRHLHRSISEIKKLGCSNEMVAVPMYFQVIEWFKEVHKMNVGIFYHSDSPTCCAVVEKFTDKGLELFGNEEDGTLLEFICVPRIQEKSQLKKAILEALKFI